MSSTLQACGRRLGLSIGHGFRHVSCKVNTAITPFEQFRFAFATNRSTFAFNARCGFSCDSCKAESAVPHRFLPPRALFSSSSVIMEGACICKEDDGQNFSKLEEIEEAIGSPLDSSPSVPAPKPLILVISGPSGVGKDAVIKRLQEVQKNIHFVVTATTRDKRPGEVDGKDYHFLSKDEFTSLINRDELLEYAVVYGDYKGIPKQQIRDFMSKDYDIVLRVDVQGAATLRRILGTSALFIFLVAESEVALVKRLMERKTETQKKLLLRISTAREEMKRMNEFDYVVVNAEGQLERTVNLIRSIIDAEKAKVQQRCIEI